MGKFKDSSCLLRLAALFVVGLIAFIAIRAAVIPESFGQYGPYRGKALTCSQSPMNSQSVSDATRPPANSVNPTRIQFMSPPAPL